MTTLKFGYWMVDLQTRQATEIGVVASEHTDFVNDRIRSLVIKPGARGEPVIVLGMTDAYTLKAASNGIAKPVYENQVFASAVEASLYLGYGYKRIGNALASGGARSLKSKFQKPIFNPTGSSTPGFEKNCILWVCV
jgi:hypothetical protein